MSYVLDKVERVEMREVELIQCDGCGKKVPKQTRYEAHQAFPFDWWYIGVDYDPGPEHRRFGHACSQACAHLVVDKVKDMDQRHSGWSRLRGESK